MKRKLRLTLIFFLLILSAITFSIIFIDHTKKQDDPSSLQFLQVYGSINYIPDEDNTVTLAFITKGGLTINEEPISVSFDSKYVIASNVILTESISAKDYTLWYLTFNAEIQPNQIDTESIDIKSITLNGSIYDEIGTLTLNVIRNDNSLFSFLNLKSCDGASFGINLSDYHATFANEASSQITILNIEIPCFPQANSFFTIDESTYNLDDGNVIIDPSSLANLRVNLSNCTVDSVNVYYIAPIVYYNINGSDYQIALDYFTAGLNITKKELSG